MDSPHSFVDGLLTAIRETWSGAIIIQKDAKPVGQVMLKEGRFAWATCKGQSETLGIFLWRLGRITKEQLAEVQSTFKAHGGKKKLGIILEESGLMSHQVLRRCLQLHTRSAVDALLAIPEVAATFATIDQPADERFLFSAEEVLPRELTRNLFSEWHSPDGHHSRTWHSRTAQNVILEELTDFPGCLLAAVISRNGDIISAYTEEELDVDVLAVHVSALLETSARLADESQSGFLNVTNLSCEQRQIIACWLDHKRRYAGFLLAEGDEPALIQINESMIQMRPKLYDWIARGHELELQMVKAVSTRLGGASSEAPPPAPETSVVDDEREVVPAVPFFSKRPQPPERDNDIFALVRRNLQSYGKQNAFDVGKDAPPRDDPYAAGAGASARGAPEKQDLGDQDIFSEVRRTVAADGNEPDIFSEVRRQIVNVFSDVRPESGGGEQSAFSIKRGEQERKSDAFAVAKPSKPPDRS